MTKPWTIIHLALAAIHALVGVLVWVFLTDGIEDSRQEVYETTPRLVTDGGTFDIVIEQKVHFRASPIEIHALVSVLTAVSHVVSATKYACTAEGVCETRPNVVRWSEYAITATLMTLSGYLTVGHGDLYVLLTMIFLGISLQLCGYYIERHIDGDWGSYLIVGTGIETGIVLPITLWTLYTENVQIGILDAWIAYSIYYALFPVLAWYDAKYKPNFGFTDKIYVILSFTSKMALLWITVGAIMANVTGGDVKEGWIAVVRAAEVVPAVVLAAFVSYLYWNNAHVNPSKTKYSKLNAPKNNLVF